MTEITSQTTFSIATPAAIYEESADLVILPENSGVQAYRELHYPGTVFPPIIYPDDPDDTVNFDSAPLTARPLVKTERTIAGNQTALWKGYQADRLVTEIWKGSEKISRMKTYYLRRLIEYFFNPPLVGFITWIPKDRGDNVGYYIRIHGVTAGGGEDIRLNMAALRADLAIYEIQLAFSIVGVAE